MDQRSYATQDMCQRGSTRVQYNFLQPQFVQSSRSIPQRERYRATQHDHPMYDAVEDADSEQDAQLDSFGKLQPEVQ